MLRHSKFIVLGLIFVFSLHCHSVLADLMDLPANSFVEIKTHTDQRADPTEKGHYARQGWNKIVYDPDGRRVLLYDRWIDKKHGGYTIYGNCLFAFDPAAGTMA